MKINYPIAIYFSKKAKETIACTGIDPECQPVICSLKKSKKFCVETILYESDVLLKEEIGEENNILVPDKISGHVFFPEFLVNRISFAEEFFGSFCD